MKETTKQNLSILIISLLIAGSVFIFLNYTKPGIQSFKQTLIDIEVNKQKLKLLEDYQNKFQSLLSAYESSQDKVDLINQAIPDNSQTSQIIATLDAISQKSSVKLNYMNFTEQEKENYGTVIIATELTTSYEGLKNWLQEIEKELRLIDLNQINIKPAVANVTTGKKLTKTTSPQTLLNCNISLTAYYQI